MAKILVIEDNRFTRLAVEKYLKSAGHETLSASNGREGLELVCEKKPDLILLDLAMPVMSGEEFLSKLRSHPECGNIPVIVLTALAEKGKVLEVLRYGAEGYITKPFSPSTLLLKVNQILDQTVGDRASSNAEPQD